MFFYTQQDIDSIKDFYENTYKLLISVAYGILNNMDDSEEVVHDVYLRLADNYNRYRKKSRRELKSLAIIITKHTSINLINKRKRMNEILVDIEDMAVYSESVQEEYFKRYKEQEVRDAIAKLKEQDKCILILRYYHDMKYSDIGKTLSISKKSVEMRLRRARHRIKEILENEQKE